MVKVKHKYLSLVTKGKGIMKKHLIIGGSGGIGSAIINQLSDKDEIVNFSRREPAVDRKITHHGLDVLKDEEH